MSLLVDHTDEKKQRPCTQTMIDHLQDCTRNALMIERKQPKHHKTQVAYGRICNQLLYIRLRIRNRGAIDNTDHGEERDPRGGLEGGLRKEGQVETQEAVGSQFQQNPCQDDRASGGCLHVRVGQPGMQGPHWNLNSKRGGERKEEPHLYICRDIPLGCQIRHGEGPSLNTQPQNGQQH